ncbi:MAG: hypothetical protein HY763_05120 [Planctomycetes bacterium]|nr:hypothetical protein [Planctomycetota bacterium]
MTARRCLQTMAVGVAFLAGLALGVPMGVALARRFQVVMFPKGGPVLCDGLLGRVWLLDDTGSRSGVPSYHWIEVARKPETQAPKPDDEVLKLAEEWMKGEKK